jgi:hypothetical protein
LKGSNSKHGIIDLENLKLNLGSGDKEIDGYINLDRKTGGEIYPLPYADGTIEEIRASHVLEHFSHREIGSVMHEWARVLKPGGLMQIAVPDFEYCARHYLAGHDIPLQGYVMGGQVDGDDFHKAVFDEGALRDSLMAAGLIGITRWKSQQKDCAALPVSLNLQGYKAPEKFPKTCAVMSTPRLGFMDNYFCAYQLPQMGIQLRKHTGAFWGQCLTRAIQETLKDDDPEFILTIDYDTLFTKLDVQAMLMVMMTNPDIDALAPVQASRTKSTPLMTIRRDGQNISDVPYETFEPLTTPIQTAHFGLTLIRVKSLKQLPHPWFMAQPDPSGEWGAERTDDDIHFWRQWEAAGLSLHLANRVAVGHAELMIRWPGQDMKAIYQHPSEFWSDGKPEGVWK